MPQPPTKESIEDACQQLLDLGIGPNGSGHVVIRSGAMGAFVRSGARTGQWIDAYWSEESTPDKIVDVTGAGNSFLGGLAAGLMLEGGDVYAGELAFPFFWFLLMSNFIFFYGH